MAGACARVAEAHWFQYLVIGVIVVNGIGIGLETYDGVAERHGDALDRLDTVVLSVFVVELAIRITAHGRRPWRFFGRGWNCFDFAVVAASLVPGLGANAALLRTIRVLRLVRLVEVLGDLRVIVRGLARSLAPLAGVATLTLLLVYIYAIVGNALFGSELPEDWGSAGQAMFTCFRILTLDNWTYLVADAREVTGWAVPYFLSFILVATFVVVNLVIAVIVNSVEEARRVELAAEAEQVARDRPPSEIGDRIRALRAALDELERGLVPGDRGPERSPGGDDQPSSSSSSMT